MHECLFMVSAHQDPCNPVAQAYKLHDTCSKQCILPMAVCGGGGVPHSFANAPAWIPHYHHLTLALSLFLARIHSLTGLATIGLDISAAGDSRIVPHTAEKKADLFRSIENMGLPKLQGHLFPASKVSQLQVR